MPQSKRPTEKQRDARWRNHRIWRLRGAWWNCGPLDPDLLDLVRGTIDLQLKRLGAEPEGEREKTRQQKFREEHGG
jgi:hypothetical protein